MWRPEVSVTCPAPLLCTLPFERERLSLNESIQLNWLASELWEFAVSPGLSSRVIDLPRGS